MCKTLYDLFTSEPNEQALYHSIATVATLLLRIGEVGKRFSTSRVPRLQTNGANIGNLDAKTKRIESESDEGDASDLGNSFSGEEMLPENEIFHRADNTILRKFPAETGASLYDELRAEGDDMKRMIVFTDASPIGSITEQGGDQSKDRQEVDENLIQSRDQAFSPDLLVGGAPNEVPPSTEVLVSTSSVKVQSQPVTKDIRVRLETISNSSKVDNDWSITYEQFLASMLTETPLVSYFESRRALADLVKQYRERRLCSRQTSAMGLSGGWSPPNA